MHLRVWVRSCQCPQPDGAKSPSLQASCSQPPTASWNGFGLLECSARGTLLALHLLPFPVPVAPESGCSRIGREEETAGESVQNSRRGGRGRQTPAGSCGAADTLALELARRN